jgi:multiple sugar transport system permease protein
MIRRDAAHGVAVAAGHEPDASPPARAGTRLRSLNMRRAGRWIAEKGWVHVLLLTAVALCLYPFVWMFMTSIKTDEELSQATMTPAVPAFRPESPYVRDEAKVERPQDAPAAEFEAVLPALQELTTRTMRSGIGASVPPSIDRERWIASASSVLLNRLLARVPTSAWSAGANGDQVRDAYVQLLTPEAIGAAISDQLSRLELSALTLRTLDGHTFSLASSTEITDRFRVESGTAALVSTDAGGRLDYAFRSGSDQPVVLVHDFMLPPGVDPASIHKVTLSLRADDSWHRMTATLDVGHGHWESTKPTYLAQNRAMSISFQPPSFDDTTIRARTWVPLRAGGASDRDRNARLRVVLSPSSTLQGTFGKVMRNYLRAFNSVPFFQYVGNSLILVALTIAGALFSSAFVAYAFARLNWPGRGVALVILLSTMMVPSQVTMIPSFLVWRGLGWYNTLNPLWVPAWLGSAFFIFLMVQHMKTIPKELEEAARIDGLNVVQTWWYVIVPQLKPTLAAIAIMSFLGAWNDFLGPLIYLRDQSKFPLSLGLFGMRIMDASPDWSMLMAGNMLMTLPSIVVFFAFQRYFIEGMTVSGMKG